MTTTRYIEVKVTGCRNCPHFIKEHEACFHQPLLTRYGSEKQRKLVIENKDQLTDSCPMIAKEGEKKDAN